MRHLRRCSPYVGTGNVTLVPRYPSEAEPSAFQKRTIRRREYVLNYIPLGCATPPRGAFSTWWEYISAVLIVRVRCAVAASHPLVNALSVTPHAFTAYFRHKLSTYTGARTCHDSFPSVAISASLR